MKAGRAEVLADGSRGEQVRAFPVVGNRILEALQLSALDVIKKTARSQSGFAGSRRALSYSRAPRLGGAMRLQCLHDKGQKRGILGVAM